VKILVYGAGNIGSLYAGLLQASGHDVSILARGQRLDEIREQGIKLRHAVTGAATEVRVDVVERLGPNDAYDLTLVVLPRDHQSEVLPILAANQGTPSVMFFGHNAAGPRELVDALGRDRVLLGFPGAAAIRRDGEIHYLITSAQEQPTTVGELEGIRSPRIEAIEQALQAAGFSAAICSNMVAWLKTHAAEIGPTATALYMAAGDRHRLARTRDALVLMRRAIREGHGVLSALGVPITPAIHRIFRWLPEPLLVAIMRRMIEGEEASIKIGHALGARNEMRVLADEFRALAATASVATPALNRLCTHLDASTTPMADGSAELSLDWRGVWVAGLGLAAVAVLITIWLL
jgi:2-dehydropantoate 2-reductase|tara:strand:- start:579 stop:1625 length:1047 start_codon:yes stop_codon:yes gene_type:complete